MHVLLVYAHPEPNSFNGALRDAIVEEVRDRGHSIEVSDLYADDFHARGGPADVTARRNDAFFHYQAEQTAAARAHTFAAELKREQDKLRRAELLILQFPIWWSGPPAVVKGWFDRVAAYGVAYVDGARFDNGLFKGRQSLISVTTGGTTQRFSPQGCYGSIDQVLWPIQQGFLGYLGFTRTAPQVAYAAPRSGADERQAAIEALRRRVRELLAAPCNPTPIPSPEALLASVGDRGWSHSG